ncbi:uncharacterized protein LOC113079801 isoform X1 [Carassius auratus]|uniref:Uncharacterized protein LOC113079801 isoform X1 n=1 Tax=Carassius auratus TaxID=7957 RepID=A0A6P6NHB2_CARAU|nr:uncharacterized protein LOC113079801 isoform X1 [Carassius auratus]
MAGKCFRDPPADRLSNIQSCFMDFLWEKLHCIQRSVLNPPKEERGLMHLQSQTLRIEFIQRLLTDSEISNWSNVLFSTLRGSEGLRLGRDSLWLDPQKLKLFKIPGFYQKLFKVWAISKIPQKRTVNSVFWLLNKPLIFGSCLGLSSEWSYFVTEENLLNSGSNVISVSSETEKLGMRSTRLVSRALDKWRITSSETDLKLLLDYSLGFINPDSDSFPGFYLTPIMDSCGGCFLELNSLIVMGSDVTSGKICYKIHAFIQCSRLTPLFAVLNHIFNYFNECEYLKPQINAFIEKQSRKYQCQLFNFILGHAKIAIYSERKAKNDLRVCNDLNAVYTNYFKSRILIDLNYFCILYCWIKLVAVVHCNKVASNLSLWFRAHVQTECCEERVSENARLCLKRPLVRENVLGNPREQ